MNEALQLINDEVQEQFSITDDKSAEWAVKKIAEERAEAQRYLNLCETMIQEYKFKAQKAEEKLERDTSYLKSMLMQYFETVPKKATKTKESYQLASGTLVKKFGTKEFIRDEETLLNWLKSSGKTNLVKTKESADWATLKKEVTVSGNSVITTDGEIVEGVKVQDKPDTFEIEF